MELCAVSNMVVKTQVIPIISRCSGRKCLVGNALACFSSMAVKRCVAINPCWWKRTFLPSPFTTSTQESWQFHGPSFFQLLPFHEPSQMRSFSTGMTGRKKMMLEKMVRRNKVQSFDNLIESQKPLRRMLSLKNALANYPRQAMVASELGRRLEAAGVMHQRKAIYLLEKYPAIFKISENPLWDKPFVEFTKEARELVEEEERIRKWYEPYMVENVAKLLMMSIDKRLRLDHLCQLDQELGLPHDFGERIVNGYPDFFKVVEGEDGSYLELTHWNDSLAVTAREKHADEKPLYDKTRRPLFSGFPLFLPKGHRLGLKDTQAMNQWQKLPFTSPYEDAKWVDPMSPDAGKRAVAVVHEFLSLTVEKRTTTENLDLFRKQFKLPGRLPFFLHKHFGIFYVTEKGNRNTVFLKEAYRAIDHPKKVAHLIDKGPLVLLNEQFEKLMEPLRSQRIPGLGRMD